jgi:hypothetical protein
MVSNYFSKEFWKFTEISRTPIILYTWSDYLKTGLSQTQKTYLCQRMHLGMRQSDILELSRDSFNRLVHDIENSELFRKLSCSGENRAVTVIPVRRYIPFTPREIEKSGELFQSGGFLDEEVVSFAENDAELDLETMIDKYLQSDRELFEKISSMPVDLFYYYFIDGIGTDFEIAELLDLPVEKVGYSRNIIDKTLLRSEMSYSESSGPAGDNRVFYEIAAELFPVEGSIQMDFCCERQRYRVDDERIDRMLKQGEIPCNLVKDLKKLRENMHMVNSHFNLLYNLVRAAVNVQEKYLLSGNIADMQFLEEKEIASMFGVHFSWISRLINGKHIKRYIKIKNKCIPIRSLFISRRELKKTKGKYFVKQILHEIYHNQENAGKVQKVSDREMCMLLREKHNINVSRRTLNNWHRELEKTEG